MDLSRRSFLGAIGGALAGGAAVGAGATALVGREDQSTSTEVEFWGRTQAGITDPAQDHAAWIALSATDLSHAEVIDVMRVLTSTAAGLSAGQPPRGDTAPELWADGPAGLTVTFAFGPGLFDRAGLHARTPDGLVELPAFTKDRLREEYVGGDLLIQIGSNNRSLVSRTGQLLVERASTMRHVWTQLGFTTRAGSDQPSRNLMGQVEGTGNPHADADFEQVVFRPDGSSIVVVRRIRMLLPEWEGLTRAEQERVIGRAKERGAALGSTDVGPLTNADLSAQHGDGSLTIAPDAHARMSHPSMNRNARMLRRGFSYDDGAHPDGGADAGLLFAAWQADARTGFVPVQSRLDVGDALNRFTVAEGSAIGYAPRGAAPGEYVGQYDLEG